MSQRVSDQQLLREYSLGSDAAFTELASRHAGIVYSAAKRQLGDSHLAEDATQLVFLAVARKAAFLSEHKVLAAWLLQATTFECRNLAKRRERQARRIRRVWTMRRQDIQRGTPMQREGRSLWDTLSPQLDAALACLREQERLVLVLRFFEQKGHGEAAQALGISEESVRQRVSRALAKLRRYFRDRGIETSTEALASSVAAHAVQPPPAGVLKAVIAVAVTSAGAKGATAALAPAKGASVIMAFTKSQVVAGLAVLAGMGTLAAVYTMRRFPVRTVPVATPKQPVIQTVLPNPVTLSGTLLGPDGKPVAGARIQVGTPSEKASLYKDTGHAAGATDTNGRFTVSIPAQKAVLVFTADPGCAIVTPAVFTGGKVSLQPWARIQGTLSSEHQPKPNTTIHLWHWDRSDCFDPMDEQTARTDAGGKFQFHRVQPSTDVSLSYPMPGGQYQRFLELRPAESAAVMLGGAGREVTGRAGPVIGSNPPVGWTTTRTRSSHGQLWYREGPALAPACQKRPVAVFNIAADGSFRLTDLPPGTYRAELRLIDEPVDGHWTPPAMAVANFTVPETPDPRPIELGTIATKAAESR